MGDTRCRVWTGLVYPESAPVDWIDKLRDLRIEFVVSPLHDRDVKPDGSLKKPHYHIVLIFTNVKSYDQVNEIMISCGSQRPERVHNLRCMIRYLAHLDDKDKAQYSFSDIQSFGGIDLEDLLKPTSTEKYVIINEIRQFIVVNDITEFEDIYNYSAEYRFDDWFKVITDGYTFLLTAFLKSRRNRNSKFKD